MTTIHNPKYDNDTVNLGYLNKRLEEEKVSNEKNITVIPKNYSSPPVPPYYINSLLMLNSQIYKCVKSRLQGSFNMSDWKIVVSTVELDEAINFIYDVNKLEYVEQGDGIIETFYQSEDPSLKWSTDIEKAKHVSDLWTTNNLVQYQYEKMATSPVTYKWKKLSVPVSLFDIIDGHKTIFLKEPSNYKKDDLWLGVITKMAIENSTTFDEQHWIIRDDFISSDKIEQEEYHKVYLLPKITEINRYSMSEIKKAIDEITLTVSKTYTTKTEVEKYVDDIKTDIAEEYTTKTEMNAQIEITSTKITQVVEKNDVNSNKIDAINQEYSKMTQTTKEIEMNFKKMGGLNLIPNSSGQNGTVGYRRNMMKPYIEIESEVELPYNGFVYTSLWAFNKTTLFWYYFGYDGTFNLRFEWKLMDGSDDFHSMPSNYVNDKQWKEYLISEYEDIYINNTHPVDYVNFSSIENNDSVSKYNFVHYIDRTTVYGIDDTIISIEPFNITKNEDDKLYLQFKYKNKIIYGYFSILIVQLDGDFKTYGYNNSAEYIGKHALKSEAISLPCEINKENEWISSKYEIKLDKKTTQIYVSFVTSGNFEWYIEPQDEILKRNPILEPFNDYEYNFVEGTTLFKSEFKNVMLTYFSSFTIPIIDEMPDFSKLWLVENDIYENDVLKYEKDKFYTIDTKINKWVLTPYTNKQIDNVVNITFFNKWIKVKTGFSVSEFLNTYKGTVEIADLILSTVDSQWQPKQGENYWGRNIKFSGENGIYMKNEKDGYTRIMNEKEDISKNDKGEINWRLTSDGQLVKNQTIIGNLRHGPIIKVPSSDGIRTYFVGEDN